MQLKGFIETSLDKNDVEAIAKMSPEQKNLFCSGLLLLPFFVGVDL